MTGKKITASKIFQQKFGADALREIYTSKVSLSRAVGVDGVKTEAFRKTLDEEISLISRKAISNTYNFSPYREKLISKGRDSFPRVISVPTIRDRLTLRALSEVLAAVFPEAQTYRPHVYIRDIRKTLNEQDGDDLHFLRMDIRSYYDKINHELLLKRLYTRVRKSEIRQLIRMAVETPTGRTRKDGKKNDVGVPQGLSVSNILAGLFLQNLDRKYKCQALYFRYVDDLLIICNSEKEARDYYSKIKKSLSDVKLETHELDFEKKKSYIATLDAGVEYLGYHISKKQTIVRDQSLRRMYTNLLRVFTQRKYRGREPRFLWRLNLKITGCVFEEKRLGWVFFFSQISHIHQLRQLDLFIEKQFNKREMDHLLGRNKSFVKSFHEIKYNLINTSYIPNFDKYTIEMMIKDLSLIHDKDEAVIRQFSDYEIEQQFYRLIRRETAELEEDLFEHFS